MKTRTADVIRPFKEWRALANRYGLPSEAAASYHELRRRGCSGIDFRDVESSSPAIIVFTHHDDGTMESHHYDRPEDVPEMIEHGTPRAPEQTPLTMEGPVCLRS